MTDAPVLWYLNRSTGLVLLVLLTAVVVVGVLATFGRSGRGVPRFLTQALHRNLGLLACLMLAGHVASAVVDTYVQIAWWESLVPFRGSYRPLWLGLGAVAVDLLVLVVLTSLLRTRLAGRSWRAVHLMAYGAWVAAVVHGIGIGTDTGTDWARGLTLGCVAAVAAAILLRVSALLWRGRAWAR